MGGKVGVVELQQILRVGWGVMDKGSSSDTQDVAGFHQAGLCRPVQKVETRWQERAGLWGCMQHVLAEATKWEEKRLTKQSRRGN